MTLGLALIGLSICVVIILWLVYLIFSNKRFIRLRVFTTLAVAYFASPAFSFVVKSYGVDVDASWNGSPWTRDVLFGFALLLLFILEYDVQKSEASSKYIHEFKCSTVDLLSNNMAPSDVAKAHGIPLERVEAILNCIVWLESNTHTRNGASDEAN